MGGGGDKNIDILSLSRQLTDPSPSVSSLSLSTTT